MRTFLELFARRGVVVLALIVAVGGVVMLNLDDRIGTLLIGVIFGLSGIGHWLVAERKGRYARVLHRAMGVFLTLFGLFTVVVVVIKFIRGEQF